MPEPWSEGAVVVTGGTGQIGRAIARAFLLRGANVAVVGSTAARAGAARQELAAFAPKLEALALDLARPGAAPDLLDRVRARFGPVAVLVNGAGVNFASPLAEITEADFDHVVGSNLRAAFFCSQAACAQMAAAGIRGRIVNITSGNWRYTRPNAGLYAATKAALEMLTRSFALEHGRAGITVNAVAPGLIARPDETDPEFVRVASYYLANSPLDALVTADDVAAAVMFLASAQAAHITGESLVVDAGFSIGRFDFPKRPRAGEQTG
jgi:NAD(P)-dependent dehydrogenase (short-subunit alcohol dehydrogenase family)